MIDASNGRKDAAMQQVVVVARMRIGGEYELAINATFARGFRWGGCGGSSLARMLRCQSVVSGRLSGAAAAAFLPFFLPI